MSLLEKLCKELGIEIGEEWKSEVGDTYKITKDGLFYEWTMDEWDECGVDDYRRLLAGELKPKWKPQCGDTFYIAAPISRKLYYKDKWANHDADLVKYDRGFAFKTKEEAIDMANKLLEITKNLDKDNNKEEMVNITPYQAVRKSISLLEEAMDLAYTSQTEDAPMELEPTLSSAGTYVHDAIQELEIASVYVSDDDE